MKAVLRIRRALHSRVHGQARGMASSACLPCTTAVCVYIRPPQVLLSGLQLQ